MPKSNLAGAVTTLVHWISEAYTRQGTGPKLEPEDIEALGEVVLAFQSLDNHINRLEFYPPVEDEFELEDCRGFTGVFDRIVVGRTGIFGRRPATGTWDRLRTGAEVERIQAADEARKAAEAAAREHAAALKNEPSQ